MTVFAYLRFYRNRAPKGLNFDNPVYRRTTEDEFCIEPRNTYLQPRALTSVCCSLYLQPRALTSVGYSSFYFWQSSGNTGLL